MLTPERFNKEYDDAGLREELPGRPITTVRDLQFLYGKLYTLATAGSGPYAAYLTPDAARGYADEPENLLVLRFDLSGNEPALADPAVRTTRFTDEDIDKLGHSKYEPGQGIDHSVTHQLGSDADVSTITYWTKRVIGGWFDEAPIQAAADDHPDGWILEAMNSLVQDDAVMDRLIQAVQREVNGPRSALLTIEVRTEKDGPFKFPGEMPVFLEAMRRRKLSKLVSKGEAKNSSGSSAGLLTGEEGGVVGTAADPLNYYLGKQLEKFPGFDPERSWQTHPISENGAVTIQNAATFIDACSYRTRFGARVYYLPYFHGKVDPQAARTLYYLLYNMVQADTRDHATPVEQAYEQLQERDLGDPYDLRFFVASILPHQKLRWDVLAETLHGRINHPAKLRDAHFESIQTWRRQPTSDGTPRKDTDFPTHQGWLLLNDTAAPNALLGAIASGRYFWETFPLQEGADGPREDDPRIHALVSVLAGETIDVATLLSGYVERLIQDESDEFPGYRVASQYAQLLALTQASLLSATTPAHEQITKKPETHGGQDMNTDRDADNPARSGAEARAQKLTAFLDQTPALRENPERRSAFLLGALTGHIGSYQRRQNVSLTVIDQHPVKGLTKANLKRRAREVLDKDIIYSRDRGMAGTMFAEVVDRLRDALLASDPQAWSLSLDDLRFYYALGITYGMNDASAFEARQEIEATTTT